LKLKQRRYSVHFVPAFSFHFKIRRVSSYELLLMLLMQVNPAYVRGPNRVPLSLGWRMVEWQQDVELQYDMCVLFFWC
jgi:hypothetical protein